MGKINHEKLADVLERRGYIDYLLDELKRDANQIGSNHEAGIKSEIQNVIDECIIGAMELCEGDSSLIKEVKVLL